MKPECLDTQIANLMWAMDNGCTNSMVLAFDNGYTRLEVSYRVRLGTRHFNLFMPIQASLRNICYGSTK